MLEPKRVDRLVLELPRDHRVSTSIFDDDPGYESPGRRQKARMIFWPNQRTFAERSLDKVTRYVVLGIAEILDRSDCEDDLLSRSLRGLELPIELLGIEFVSGCFDAVPVGPESQQLKGIFEQRVQRGGAPKAESFHLARPKADSEQHRIPRPDGYPPPFVVHRAL